MGILGPIELVKRTREVAIGCTSDGELFTVTVSAPRLQLIPELKGSIPEPTAPAKRDDAGRVKLRRNASTGELIKNASGQAVPEIDYMDAGYQRDVANVERARTIAMIMDCVKFPGATALDRNEFKSPVEWELARWAELEEAGLDVGAYKGLSDAVVSLSDPMTRDEIEEARIALGTDKETQDAVREAALEKGEKPPKGK